MSTARQRSPEWQARAAAVLDPARPPVALPAGLLDEVYQHAREGYGEEACGLLVGPGGGPPERIERCTNVQTRRKLAGESELDAREGYWIDERELLLAQRRASENGHELLVIYHSHVDTGAYFSHADLAAALGPGGTPLWPGVAQLVVSVYEDGVRDVVWFDWDDVACAFMGHAVERVG